MHLFPSRLACLVLAGIAEIHAPASARPAQCDAGGVQLQVLGSGGPIADDGRASAAYLVWIDGRSSVLVDAGGGAFLRFGEAGARFEELDHVAVSHFHTDHSADLVTLLKTGFFTSRERPLPISGPGGRGPFPGLGRYLDANLGDGGAYHYLGGYLDGSGGLVRLEQAEIDPDLRTATTVAGEPGSGFHIAAIGVPHGPVPALAFRVHTEAGDIVFATDQNGSDESFVDFARGADLLVMHMVIPEDADEVSRRLHAPPGRIGEIAAAAAPGKLVLSHFMARSLDNLDANVALVRDRYRGEVIVASDLACVDLD